MKKLLFLAAVLFALCACSRDGMNSPGNSPGETEIAPHFYGWMTLDNAAPETRGVANSSKVWSRPIAEKNLTVKFLNGTERYQQFVKDVAPEWEKHANVKFRFVEDDEDALIRVGFDYVKGMSSSWALTGTDHLQVYDKQDEATVHFSQWRRASDAAKRSDVLRAFGPVLGLELEFRHPDFTPGWITDANGNIDEEAIRAYWEYELNELISWEELKKVVLDPLNVPAFLIEKTDSYDSNSVMSWPFYEMIAQNIPIVEFDEDYKTELSEQDKAFIASLYGEPEGGITGPGEDFIVPLVEFDFTGSKFRISLSTSSNLIIYWDRPDNATQGDLSYVNIPDGVETPYKVTVNHLYTDNNAHHIVIKEIAKSANGMPTESYALQGFDLQTGVGMENLNFQPQVPNKALSYVRVRGGVGFVPQHFNFEDNEYLKELYLTEIGDSKVSIKNCQNLEIFATSPYIAKLTDSDLEFRPFTSDESVETSKKGTVLNNPVITIIPKDSLTVVIPPLIDTTIHEGLHRYYQPWPVDPLQNHSFSNSNISGLTIQNCPNLKKLGLENTRLKTFDFSNLTSLEYVYLSSTLAYIIGNTDLVRLNNLKGTLRTLKDRSSDSTGQIIIRGMIYETKYLNPGYEYSAVEYDKREINTMVTDKNWSICWDPIYEFRVLTTSND